MSFIPRLLQDSDPALVICIMFLPIVWGTIINIGAFSLEPFHISMFLIIGMTFYRPSAYGRAFAIIQYHWIFFVGFFAYLFLNLVSYIQTLDGKALDAFVIKQIAFVIMGLAVAVRVTERRSMSATLYVGGALSMFTFLLALAYSAYTAGTSLVAALAGLVASGSYQAWTFGFLRHVFNAFSSHNAAADLEFVTALKNNVATGLLIAYICFRAGATRFHNNLGAKVVDIFISALFLVCIVMMLSRSVVLALLLVIMIVIVVDAIARNNATVFISVLVAVAAGMVLFMALPDTVIEALQSRFEDTGSYDSRVEVYAIAIPLIEKHFWIGQGIGAPLPNPNDSIHNLFLSAWFNTGILGFLTSAWFWLTAVAMVCLRILEVMLGRYRSSYELTIFHAWIAVVPIMGLFRCWLIGGGNLNFSAWFSLGLFFAILYQEKVMQKVPAGQQKTGAPLTALPR
ncbi:MAG: O-antigen ligase family protein [Rhodospirillales bacterium]